MVWLILGCLCMCGAILLIVPDRRASGDVTFIDRSQLRRGGGIILGISATALAGWFVLVVLANWVSDGL